MQVYFYCKSWFRAKKQATFLYSEVQARELHLNGKPYCVLVGSVEYPTCFIEVTSDFIGVGFLDTQLRERLSYQFQEKEPGTLFLSLATWRKFEKQSDKVSEGTTYIFNFEGVVSIRRETFIPEHTLDVSESISDLKGHWEKYPKFGEYKPFTRSER